MNTVVCERRPAVQPGPANGNVRQTIASIERLAQCWRAGLLSDDEFQAAASDVLGVYLPVDLLLWNYQCDELVAPLD